MDVARAQYLDLTAGAQARRGRHGRDESHGRDQVDGRTFLVENYDPISALSYWRDGELGLRDWVASVRRADETAWFARDDLRPFGLMCVHMGWHAITRPFGLRRRGGAGRPATGPRYRRGRAAAPRAGREPGAGAGAAEPHTRSPDTRPEQFRPDGAVNGLYEH
jgi:D-aspartate ligase